MMERDAAGDEVDLIAEFAEDPAVAEILRARTRPSVGRRASEEHCPEPNCGREAGHIGYHGISTVRWQREWESKSSADPQAPSLTFSETWDRYKAALYDIHSAVGLATSLLRQEGFRTPVGGRSWKTLHALATKAGEISEALRTEIASVPEGNGLVE